MRSGFHDKALTALLMIGFISLTVATGTNIVFGQQVPNNGASNGISGNLSERERGLMDRERALRAQESEAVNRNRRNAGLNSKADTQLSLTSKQIHEDFEKIQLLSNQMKTFYNANSVLDYKQIADGTGEIKKRAERLKENLALPKARGEKGKTEIVVTQELPQTLSSLHALIKSFVSSPFFLNPNIIDAQHLIKTRAELDQIIKLSELSNKEAKKFNKLSSRFN